jgi:plasmid stabilization system protein ParE
MSAKLHVEWHPLALEDLDHFEIRGEMIWSPEIARKQREKLIRAALLLAKGIRAHRPVKSIPDVYGYYIPRTSFRIYYRIQQETLIVLRYWHTSRDGITPLELEAS